MKENRHNNDLGERIPFFKRPNHLKIGVILG